jgi:hypothetical protein
MAGERICHFDLYVMATFNRAWVVLGGQYGFTQVITDNNKPCGYT